MECKNMFNIINIMDNHNFDFSLPFMTLVNNKNINKLDYRD